MTEPYLMDNDRIKVKEDQNKLSSMWKGVDFGPNSSYAWYKEDFFDWDTDETGWTITDVGGNTRSIAAAAPCIGGYLDIRIADADNNLCSMQKLGHSFLPTSGSNIFFEVKLQVSEATQSQFLFGLVITDTSPLTTTDGIYFRKDDGYTEIDIASQAGSSESIENGVGNLADDTEIVLGMKIVGTSKVEYWINGSKVGEILTDIPAVPLRVTAHMQDDDTGAVVGAQSTSWDYVKVAQSRI